MRRRQAWRRFRRLGIPTVASLCEVAGTGGPVIATGGIRSGMDMAKAVALGAESLRDGAPASRTGC